MRLTQKQLAGIPRAQADEILEAFVAQREHYESAIKDAAVETKTDQDGVEGLLQLRFIVERALSAGDLRDMVFNFASLMEHCMAQNDAQKGELWKGLPRTTLLHHLEKQVQGLRVALMNQDRGQVASRAANVANYAMLVKCR